MNTVRPRARKRRGGASRDAAYPQVVPRPGPLSTPRSGVRRPAKAKAKAKGGSRNWRVRTRLLVLIAIPTATAVIVSGIRIVSATRSAMGYQRVEALASLGAAAASLAQALEDERDRTADFIAHGKPSADDIVLRQEYSYTDRAARQVAVLARRVGGAYPAQTQARAAAVLTRINSLGNLRNASTKTLLPALVVIQQYSHTIDDVLAMNDEIVQGGGDVTLAETARVLSIVSRMKEEASQQRAILDVALTMGQFPPNALSQLTVAQAEQQSNLAVFESSATADERQVYLDAVTGSFAARADGQEQNAISRVLNGGSLASDPTTADDWYGGMSDTINRMRSVERDLALSVVARAKSLFAGAMAWAVAVTAAILLVLVLALISTGLVARSMVGPLRRLRTGALEVAGVRLPEMVRQLGETGGEGPVPEVEPIGVDSTDEIGEVARAFEQVHREALRLAADEAMLRSNVSAMFVNLSRRSQALVERQIELIDELEHDEQDADRLASLFRMDHLATRMRRNSENLLVLAGHEVPRVWSNPVALINVLRAALSEIEQYDRVSIEAQPQVALNGQVVSDVVHLVAELVENATSFSAEQTPVTLSGHVLSSGGLLLDITDHGIGMGPESLTHANWMLDNPPVVDVAISRRMGLFVVARLAARHGIRVRLRPAPDGGLTAMVWLPDELVTKQAASTSPGQRRFATGERVSSAVTGSGAAQAAAVGQGRTTAATGGLAAASGPGVAGLVSPGGFAAAGAAAESPAATQVAAAVAAARMPKFATSHRQPGDDGGERDAAGSAHEANGVGSASPGPAEGPAGPGCVSSAGEPGGRAEAPRGPAETTAGPAAASAGQGGFSTAPDPAAAAVGWASDAADWVSEPGVAGPGQAPGTAGPAPGAAGWASDAAGWGSGTDEWAASGAPGDAGTDGGAAPDAPGWASGPARLTADAVGFGAAAPDPGHGAARFGADAANSAGEAGEPAPPAFAGDDTVGATGPQSVLSAPVAAPAEPATWQREARAARSDRHGEPPAAGAPQPSATGTVFVSPPTGTAGSGRLPIFEAVESEWFRHGKPSIDLEAGSEFAASESDSGAAAGVGWTSPADEGWRAAAIVRNPVAGAETPVGLPSRIPQANLIPGAAAVDSPVSEPLHRSAEAIRDRLASLQDGVRAGRAVAREQREEQSSGMPPAADAAGGQGESEESA